MGTIGYLLKRTGAGILLLAVLGILFSPPLSASVKTEGKVVDSVSLTVVLHIPEYASVRFEDGRPGLETNMEPTEVSMETYQWDDDGDYTVVYVEHS